MKGHWTAESHPSLALPGNPHFSPLVGLTHDESFMGFDIGPARARSCGLRWLWVLAYVSVVDGERCASVCEVVRKCECRCVGKCVPGVCAGFAWGSFPLVSGLVSHS